LNIRVKLISMDGFSSPYLDEWGDGVLPMKTGCTVSDVLSAIGLATDYSAIIMVNGETVALISRAARILNPDDELTVFPPIQGG